MLNQIPRYLKKFYSWTYIKPTAIKFFDHNFIVDIILSGNRKKLTNAVLELINPLVHKNVLQIACVYGDFSMQLCKKLHTQDAKLLIADILPEQIQQHQAKLSNYNNVSFKQANSIDLAFASDASFECVIIFFLFHEQPKTYIKKTLKEAMRVIKPNASIIIIEFANAKYYNPVKYWMVLIFKLFEPFALKFIKNGIEHYLPDNWQHSFKLTKDRFFAGLFERTIITRIK